MSRDHYPIYGAVLVVGSAVAVWAGMPVVFLLFLACPLIMFFMMEGMGGVQGSDKDTTTTVPPPDRPKANPMNDLERS